MCACFAACTTTCASTYAWLPPWLKPQSMRQLFLRNHLKLEVSVSLRAHGSSSSYLPEDALPISTVHVERIASLQPYMPGGHECVCQPCWKFTEDTGCMHVATGLQRWKCSTVRPTPLHRGCACSVDPDPLFLLTPAAAPRQVLRPAWVQALP